MANGSFAPNLGEKGFTGMTNEGSPRDIVAQVVEVSQPLLSVRKCVRAGNRVVFDPDGSYVEDITTGARTWMVDDGNLWSIKMWVARSGEAPF